MKILFAFVMNWLFVNGQIMTRSSMFAGSSHGVGTRSPAEQHRPVRAATIRWREILPVPGFQHGFQGRNRAVSQ